MKHRRVAAVANPGYPRLLDHLGPARRLSVDEGSEFRRAGTRVRIEPGRFEFLLDLAYAVDPHHFLMQSCDDVRRRAGWSRKPESDHETKVKISTNIRQMELGSIRAAAGPVSVRHLFKREGIRLYMSGVNRNVRFCSK